MTNARMERLRVGDNSIEYSDTGSGEPLLLVHAGVFGDWFLPMSATPELSGFRVIRMRRAGYGARSAPPQHLTIADHARHCALLLEELGVSRAHVCGHSSSALIALQLALDSPERVHSLVLLDPAPGGALLGPVNAPRMAAILEPAMSAYARGDVRAGFEGFLNAVCGRHHREVIEHRLGTDGYERAVAESAFFPDEVRAVGEWEFTGAHAARITAPMLLIDGGITAQVAEVLPESVSRLAAFVPGAEVAVLAGASHLMPLEDPRGVAKLVAGFARRWPMA